MNFEHHMNNEKLSMDESPFIHLTANAKFIDVLCVNCYECVKFEDVNTHSKTCSGKGYKDVKYGLDIELDIKRLVNTKKSGAIGSVSDDEEEMNNN